MSYQRPIQYRPGQTLRNCDVCGMRFWYPSEFIQGSDHIYRCLRFCAPKRDSTNDVLLDRDRAIALSRSRLKQMPPPPGARDFSPRPAFTEEGPLLDFVCRLSPAYVGQSRGPGTGLIPYSISRVVDIGHVLFYLCGVAVDNGRAAALRARAEVKIPEVADFLLLQQDGGTLEGTVAFGAFNSGGLYSSKNAAICGQALLHAWQVTGNARYLEGARNAGHALRMFQSSAFKATGFTSKDAAGLVPLYTGAFVEALVSGAFTHKFYTDGWLPIWFLTELQNVLGDVTLGAAGTVGGFYAEGPAAPISEMIADARGFWAIGIADAGTDTPIVGLSSDTAREYFFAFPDGDGTWQYSDGNAAAGTTLRTILWARSMAAMMAVDGQTDRLRALWDYLRSFTDDGTFATTSASPWVIADALTGIYDATISPPLTLRIRPPIRIASSMYDWRAAGTLAGVHSAYAQDTFSTLKLTLGQPRFREGRADPTPIQTYIDDLRLIGYAGLTLQTKNLASPASNTNETAAAAIVGNVYRFAPMQTKTFDARVLS